MASSGSSELSPRAREVVGAALELLEEEGPEGLSMRRLAERLRIERELPRELLTPGVEARAGRTVYEAVGGDVDLARAAWAFAHGMTILELDRRFPPDADLDAAWERGLAAFRQP